VTEPLVRSRHLSKVFSEGETRVEAVRDVDLELEWARSSSSWGR
jgi:hypothetical protein